MKIIRQLSRPLVWLVAALLSFSASAQGTVTYFHNDLLGSPAVATNESGQVIWRETYRGYGERVKNEAPSAPNKVWYTSRHQDEDTGLVYMGARYYDPAIGRFLSVDSVGFVESNIHSFNRYAYANNNPYRFKDPDGTFAFLALIPLAFEAASVASVGYTAYDTTTTYLNEGAGAAAKSLAIDGAVTVALGGAGKLASKAFATEIGETAYKTVGRHMHPDELAKMRTTGRVQEGGGGQTRVADPANPSSYANPPRGDVYVEFDVPASRVLPHSTGTGRIPGPNSPDARVPGRNPSDYKMPAARNIRPSE